MNLKREFKIIILFAALLLCVNEANCQFSNVSLSSGLTTIKIIGDSPNSSLMIPHDLSKPTIIGGSFNGTNSGIALRANIALNKKGDFTIPVGLEYFFLWAAESTPLGKSTKQYAKNTNTIPTITLGFDYKFFKFPFADVKAYAGVELRASFIQSGELNYIINYGQIDSIDNRTFHIKPPAIRGGGALKLGVDGQIVDNIRLNVNFGLGILNLIGRDNKRGELFTPSKLYENFESKVYVFNFDFLIQYQL